MWTEANTGKSSPPADMQHPVHVPVKPHLMESGVNLIQKVLLVDLISLL